MNGPTLVLYVVHAKHDTYTSPDHPSRAHRVTEVMKGIAARWRELGEAEKAEWTAKAALDKDR